jgi:ABC-2 type transport system ATP-binding protein
VSMVCERIIIIHEGQVVAVDKPENLSERLRGSDHIEVEIRGPAAQVMTALRDIPGVQEVTRTDNGNVGSYNIEATSGADLGEHISTLVHQRGWGLLRLQPIEMSLEEIFLSLTVTESDSA